MIFLKLPMGFDAVQNRIKEREWLITAFDADKEEVYNPISYQLNRIRYGTAYTLVIDRNLFQYIIKSTRINVPREAYKDAISLIIFCQIAGIDIEPAIAIYEKINYIKVNADEAIGELQDFYNIDNTDTNVLIQYALGEVDKVNVTLVKEINNEKLKRHLTRYERLVEWDSLYLLVLKLVLIYQDNNRPHIKLGTYWHAPRKSSQILS